MAQKPPVKPFRADQRFEHTVLDAVNDPLARIIVGWSKLEAALEDLIWQFLDLSDDDGKLITARLDARPKGEMLGVLSARYLGKKRTQKLDELLARVRSLQEDRNFIAHGVWGTVQPENVPAAISLRPKAAPGRVTLETFPIGRLKDIDARIEECRKEVLSLRDELVPSRQRQPKPVLP